MGRDAGREAEGNVSDPDRLAKLLTLEEVKRHVAKVLAMDLSNEDPEKAPP